MLNILPTHTCFDDAIDNLIWLMKRDGKEAVATGIVRIVHAIIKPGDEELAHAWIESPDYVYFRGVVDGRLVLIEADRQEYESHSNILYAVRYTLFEAYAEENRHKYFGPWDDRIRNHPSLNRAH